MTICDLLRDDEAEILEEASPAVGWLEHYRRDGREATRRRLGALHRLVREAVRERDLEALLAHARDIAAERHGSGYGLREVERAFSALEEAIWHRALTRLPPEERAWGLGLVATALAHARAALVAAFERLGPAGLSPALDLTAVFRGAEPAPWRGAPEDLVHPV
jgi:hypothetical protein